MTDIHARLGISRQFDVEIKEVCPYCKIYWKPKRAAIRSSRFNQLGIHYLSQFYRDLTKLQISQRDFYLAMRSLGIEVNTFILPVHRQLYFERLGFEEGYCSIAESFHRQIISIPMYPSLTEDEQQYVIDDYIP